MPDEEMHSQFVDEIIERTWKALFENPAFDDEPLQRLKELAASSGLTKFENIVEALSAGEEK